jgi:hypothetical protein
MRRRLTRKSRRIEDEIENIFAQQERIIFAVEPDPKQLREGERQLYKDSDGVYYFVTKADGELLYVALLESADDKPGMPWPTP